MNNVAAFRHTWVTNYGIGSWIIFGRWEKWGHVNDVTTIICKHWIYTTWKIFTSYLAPWGFKGWFEHSITSHASYYTGCRETAQLLFRVRVVNLLVAYLACTLPSFRQVSSSNTLPCRKSHFLYWRHHTNSAININGAAPYKALHWSWFYSRLDAWGPGHVTLPTCREKNLGVYEYSWQCFVRS